jgi:hypothetical protein
MSIAAHQWALFWVRWIKSTLPHYFPEIQDLF